MNQAVTTAVTTILLNDAVSICTTDHSLKQEYLWLPTNELSGTVMTIGFDSHLISREIFSQNSKLLNSSIHPVSEWLDFETTIMFLSLAKSLSLKCIMVTSYLPLYAGITNEALYSRFPFLLVLSSTLLTV